MGEAVGSGRALAPRQRPEQDDALAGCLIVWIGTLEKAGTVQTAGAGSGIPSTMGHRYPLPTYSIRWLLLCDERRKGGSPCLRRPLH
jgi:hypothetical protein